MKLTRSLLFSIAGMLAAFVMTPSTASAHTVRLCWQDVGPVTTFYGGTYHSPHEAPSPVGQIIIDDFGYPFTGYILAAQLPAAAQCVSTLGTGAPAVVHYQTFTSSFAAGLHIVSFDATTAVQTPWQGGFPSISFGGGACADADFDGLCNDQDACPLDAENDGDGDGLCANLDNCPLNANPDQADANHNGQGDACEGVVCGNGLLQGAEQCDDGNKAGGDGCSSICTLEVQDTAPNSIIAPVPPVDEGAQVTLNGSASNDPDGDALSYQWAQVAGTSAALSGEYGAGVLHCTDRGFRW